MMGNVKNTFKIGRKSASVSWKPCLLALAVAFTSLWSGCGLRQGQPDAGDSQREEQNMVSDQESASEHSAPEEAAADTSVDWRVREWEEVTAWYDTLTDEDFATAKMPDRINVDTDWHQRTLILLGEFPEVSLRIYGEIYGASMLILEHQGERRVFNKDFLTTRVVMPEFAVYDYDGDGTEEIGMACYVGSGTGVAIMDFSVFDSVQEPFDTLYTMPYEDARQVCDAVSMTYEEGVLRIAVGDDYEEHDLTGTVFAEMGIQALAMGDIMFFSLGEQGEVFCVVAVALALEEQVTPFFVEEFATLYTENGVPWEKVDFRFQIQYDGAGGFTATNLELGRFS